MKNKQTITKHYILVPLIMVILSVAANAARILMTLNYETIEVPQYYPLVFIGLRVLSFIFLMITLIIYNKSKYINKQKIPAAVAAFILISDILVWTLTSGQMIVMTLKILKTLSEKIIN